MRFKKLFIAIALVCSIFTLCSFKTYAASDTSSPSITDSNSSADNWNYILNNVDIDIKYLEPNKYLGLYWDSYVNGNKKDGYLFLCWTSEYYTSSGLTLLQVTESGKQYNNYSNTTQMNNKQGNFLKTETKNYPNYNLSIHMTPVAGFKNGQNFGLPLKRTYNFQNFRLGYEGTNKVIGQCGESISFDLGLIPKLDGKNSMQLCTHGYEIIEACEAQSYFDILAYGGYGHFVHFNTTIKIDKIYRVDVAYKLTNDEKPWYQFFLSDEDVSVKKSLTAERVSGGIFGLYRFQGFKQGSFQSTKNSSITYKYKLHLNYNDDAWSFSSKSYYECDYRRISEFQILRMNYVIDGETFDVPIKMDTIEGETLFILDSDLILDTDTAYFKVKNLIDDFLSNITTNWDTYKVVLTVIGVGILAIIVVMPIIKVLTGLKVLFQTKSDDSDD